MAVLPHASVAVHVQVTTRLNPVEQLVSLSSVPVRLTITDPQASLADGATGSGRSS